MSKKTYKVSETIDIQKTLELLIELGYITVEDEKNETYME